MIIRVLDVLVAAQENFFGYMPFPAIRLRFSLDFKQ
jgi:hypothetical protein